MRAVATKPQLERNQAFLFPFSPNPGRGLLFPSAVVVLAPAHTDITENKAFLKTTVDDKWAE